MKFTLCESPSFITAYATIVAGTRKFLTKRQGGNFFHTCVSKKLFKVVIVVRRKKKLCFPSFGIIEPICEHLEVLPHG